ncbi:hypothetical protein H6P81_002920 [Aristolochia fimbriata]|uniref:Aminotransferase-like plant mobile domain-containing protein n=1 Tax=Aristolochia fimbriata TaxID=158543 RepID=A0AAV7FED2_ARIFI|nr:hypothetical protein H6P81_002920 [Aristolochia fimbriata]
MAAPSVALIGGLRAFDHTVIVGDETVQTLALYKEGDASHLTYCPSGESIFGGHAVKYPSPVDRFLPYGSLSRSLATGDHIFFLPCPGSSEDEVVASDPGFLALQSALLVANRPPRTLQDRFMDKEVVPTLPGTPMDTPIPFLYEWTTLLLGRCSRTLRDAGVYHGLWASIFQYNCDMSVVRAFIDAWSTETNTLVTCQGELSVTLLDMDRIFGLPISGHFHDEVSPTVADFKDVRSSALPYSCRRLFQAYHHLCRSSGSNVISATAWVKFWFRTEDNVVPVNDPWTAWYASYGRDMPPPREFTAIERDVFDFLRVTPGKEDEVHLAALLSVWLSRFVFRSTCDDIRPMVFKVAIYIASGVRFALAGPALACLYKGLGQAVAGWPSIVQWPYLYSWLAVYFHSHGEDLGGAHRPGMVAFGNPSLRRVFDEDQAHNLFRRLPVLVWNRYALGWNSVSALVDEPKQKRPLPKAAYESLLSVRWYFLMDLPGDLGFKTNRREVTSLSELMNLWRASVIRPCGRLDLPLPGEPTRDPGVTLAYYNWWKEHISPHFEQNRLELLPAVSAVGDSEEDEDYDSDRSYPRKRRPKGKKQVVVSSVKKKRAPLTVLNDASPSMKKKPRKEVPPVSIPPSPPTFLPPIPEIEPPTSSLPEHPPVETVHISSSSEAPKAPPEGMSAIAQTGSSVAVPEGIEVVEELAEVVLCLTQPEVQPAREAVPPVVREMTEEEEATIEEEVPALVLREVETAPTPSGEELVEVEGEALIVQAVPEVVPAAEDTPEVGSAVEVVDEVPTEVADVIPAIDDVPDVTPAVEETRIEEATPVLVLQEADAAPVSSIEAVIEVEAPPPAFEASAIPAVEDTTISLTPPTPPTSTSLTTPSQQLLSHIEDAVRDGHLLADAEFVIGRLQEVSHDVTRLQVYTQKLEVLSEMESSAREKASRTSRDRAECDARESLGILSSKLEDAEITLSEVAEELSEAKDDDEDVRERLELAREQLQSARTKVVYLTTQAEQIQESVRDLKKAVVAAEQMVAEIIARPTLSATEEATLLSLRADFVESQQEIAKDL